MPGGIIPPPSRDNQRPRAYRPGTDSNNKLQFAWAYVLPDYLGSVRQLTNAGEQVTMAQFLGEGQRIKADKRIDNASAYPLSIRSPLNLTHRARVMCCHRAVVQPRKAQRRVHVRVPQHRLHRQDGDFHSQQQGRARVPELMQCHAHTAAPPVGVQAAAAIAKAQRPVAIDEDVIGSCLLAHGQVARSD